MDYHFIRMIALALQLELYKYVFEDVVPSSNLLNFKDVFNKILEFYSKVNFYTMLKNLNIITDFTKELCYVLNITNGTIDDIFRLFLESENKKTVFLKRDADQSKYFNTLIRY